MATTQAQIVTTSGVRHVIGRALACTSAMKVHRLVRTESRREGNAT
jgi:hypothetical protein